MTGWNLPPGVNECDLPGNRPIDILWEKEAEKFCENCERYGHYGCDHDITYCVRSHAFEKHFESILNLY